MATVRKPKIVKAAGRNAAKAAKALPLKKAQSLGSKLEDSSRAATGRMMSLLEEQKGMVAGVLEDIGRGLESASTGGGQRILSRQALAMGGRAAGRVSTQLRENSAEELVASAEDAIRRHPGIALAGLVGVGALGVRLFRAYAEE